jgi:hypothetical protein
MKLTRSDVAALVLFGLLGALLGVTLFGWLSGCGEHYVDINGVTHQYECFK